MINLLSLATIKTQLGISGETYDSAITAMIPIVSADIRRIMNHDYDDFVSVDIVSGSAVFSASQKLNMGDVIYFPGMTADTYISSYDWDNDEYTMTNNATSDRDYVYRTINISMWPTISKMIWYRISKMNTTSIGERALASKTIGPVSLSFANSEINKQWNYPQLLINDLGVPYAYVG